MRISYDCDCGCGYDCGMFSVMIIIVVVIVTIEEEEVACCDLSDHCYSHRHHTWNPLSSPYTTSTRSHTLPSYPLLLAAAAPLCRANLVPPSLRNTSSRCSPTPRRNSGCGPWTPRCRGRGWGAWRGGDDRV